MRDSNEELKAMIEQQADNPPIPYSMRYTVEDLQIVADRADIKLADLINALARFNLAAGQRRMSKEDFKVVLMKLQAAGRKQKDKPVLNRPVKAQRIEPLTKAGKRIGRNDLCSCGSGKKYKACCKGK